MATFAVLVFAVLLAVGAAARSREGRTVQDRVVRAASMWVRLPTWHAVVGDQVRLGWRWYVRLCHGRTGAAQLDGRRHPADCSSLVTEAGHAVGTVPAFNRPSARPGSRSAR